MMALQKIMHIAFIEYLPKDMVRWDGTFIQPLFVNLVLCV